MTMRMISGLFERSNLMAAGFGLLACLSSQTASAQVYYQRPIGPLPPHVIGEIATIELGLYPVSRVLRSGPVYYVEGITTRGARMRYTVDAYYGQILDRVVVRGPVQVPGGPGDHRRFAGLGPPDHVLGPGYRESFEDADDGLLRPPGRVRDGSRPALPQPKAASAISRPPAAPAKALPPTPAALPEKAAPRPVVKPPVPTIAPTPVPRPLPSDAKVTPDTPRPRLQNPDDLRLPPEPDRVPPMAARPGVSPAPTSLAPALLDDATPKSTRSPTAPVPVTPLD